MRCLRCESTRCDTVNVVIMSVVTMVSLTVSVAFCRRVVNLRLVIRVRVGSGVSMSLLIVWLRMTTGVWMVLGIGAGLCRTWLLVLSSESCRLKLGLGGGVGLLRGGWSWGGGL